MYTSMLWESQISDDRRSIHSSTQPQTSYFCSFAALVHPWRNPHVNVAKTTTLLNEQFLLRVDMRVGFDGEAV